MEIYFYLVLPTIWTLICYYTNVIKKVPLKRRLINLVFDFVFYPISYIMYMYKKYKKPNG